MSPRAAWRLDRLGFTSVLDYEAGKMDWLARGLPYEGEADLVARHLAEVPTCTADEPVGDVRRRLGRELDGCLVVDAGMVVGFVDPSARDGVRAGDAARFGVTTVRPSEDVQELQHRMQHAGVDRVVVSDGSGRLLGVFRRP